MKFFFLSIATLMFFTCCSQDSYKNGDIVADFKFDKILNYTAQKSSLDSLKSELTVLDFFGTWCVPCVKALPHLNDLKVKFKNEINIVLISSEQEGKLTKFIDARSPFPFPVIADFDNKFISLFQPPSYPYTIVMNKQNKIIAVTDAESLNEADLTKWLSETNDDKKIEAATIIKPINNIVNFKSSNAVIDLSQQFIYAVKTGDPAASIIQKLKDIPFDTLTDKLKTDNDKKAFWINLYNGYTQFILKEDPGKYKNRNKFFKSRQIEVAGKQFSLDEIEHGILRHSKIKLSLGYLNKPFPGKTEKALRVKKLDYRIHFALNCGAKSCPPIAFYNPENLNQQLDLATKAYLTGESQYNSIKNIIYLPALMGWFRRDFGGKKGMKKLLKKIDLLPAGSNPKIKFKKYDWNLFLDHYKTYN
jgi:thiol-disulfide isomerase/thioredoxin